MNGPWFSGLRKRVGRYVMTHRWAHRLRYPTGTAGVVRANIERNRRRERKEANSQPGSGA